MSLQIIEKNGVFFLNGKINTTTSRPFLIHFDYLLDTKDVKVNIDNVTEIDKDGMEAIEILKAIALRNNMNFSILGYGSRDIYEHFISLVA